ncbi:hypothetical protein [Arthrobacter bambusae]|uniref:hypothetical protein n=1 Tax=Arthrobacter bambusae TaxID=1338426 RepID=UPI002780131F|nr:hypothetical protein [Arthrobacter bambusae]MDQ0241393.1 hypothetical protein [Arthrobacter bambusae]
MDIEGNEASNNNDTGGATSSSVSFVDLRLTGGRFERNGFPVSALAELERLEELIEAVAKALWKRDNPSRIRIPNGFTKDFDLRLVRVDPGSVIPVMERTSRPSLVKPSDYFDASVELIEEAFAEIVANLQLPEDFPEEAAPVMARFGSSFSDDESAVFRASEAEPVEYSAAVRRKFFGAVRHGLLIQTAARIGRISALDVDEQTFTFAGLDGKKVTGLFSAPRLWSDLHEVLNQESANAWVRLYGLFRLRPDMSLHSIADVSSLEVFDVPSTESWSHRLLELADLQDGWIEDGEAIATTSLEFARDLLSREKLWKDGTPGIFPTPRGGVQLEWQRGTWERSVVSIGPNLELETRFTNRSTRTRERREPEDIEGVVEFIEERA